jgi:Xaa-Pro aminopeptidase
MDFQKRIRALRDSFAAQRVDAVAITNLKNIFYLSNFSGSTAVILLTESRNIFLTDFRYYGKFETEVFNGFELVPFYNESLGKKIGDLAGANGFKRLGFESENLTHAQVAGLQDKSGVELVPTTGLVEKLRLIKDAEEIDSIKRAVALKEDAFREVCKQIKESVTEADLAAEFEYRIRKRGAQRASFSPIVAFGPNSAMPHASFTSQQLIPGMPLTFDLGVELDGYCSDMTRTIFFGGVSPGWERIYNVVREAKAAAAENARAGMKCVDVDKMARDIIVGEGYGKYKMEDGSERDYFGHGLGHGVGLEVHEAPRLNTVSKDTLKTGMMVTIEPGIYLPGQGGIRIEDLYLVGKNGLVNLNSLKSELQVVH